MAYRGYRVVCFTPSGRKRTQSILIDNLRRFTDFIDEYQIWMNTDEDQVEDISWLRQQPDNYDWVKLVELPEDKYDIRPKQLRTALFYAHNTVDPDTIYIRFDDDVVYIDDDFFRNLLDFRIDNPDYFLVMANIWNNAMISYIQQRLLQTIPEEPYLVEEPYCMDPVGWQNGKFGELIHRLLIDKIKSGSSQTLWFDRADLDQAARFSISCFCFFGKDFAKFNGVVGQRRPGIIRYDEEVWLTEVYPTLEGRMNTICGSALVSHYTFFGQRPHLNNTDILDQYRQIAKQKLSDSYYELLEQPKNTYTPADKPQGLKVIKLPAAEYVSSYADSLRTEMAGYKAVFVTDNRVEIYNDKGDVAKVIQGKEINDRSIDNQLALLYRHVIKPLEKPALQSQPAE